MKPPQGLSQSDILSLTVVEVMNSEAFKAGYVHALGGGGYHQVYETASPGSQERYEMGRYFAVAYGGPAYSAYQMVGNLLVPLPQAVAALTLMIERREILALASPGYQRDPRLVSC